MIFYDIEGNAVATAEEWAKRMAGCNRTVAKTALPDGRVVSTVFLGIDHNFSPGGPPILWETMVFPPDSNAELDCMRYATRADAEAGHARMVDKWSPAPLVSVKRFMRRTP